MKEMIVILAFMALIASAASMQMGPSSCGQQQGHEQHRQQQHHPQQQKHQHKQQQHHQQQYIHVQQQQHHQQQKVHLQQQSQQEHQEQPEQQHHQQYQDQVQQQPLQHQFYQQCQEQPLFQQHPCQYGYEQKYSQQDNEKQQMIRCSYNYYSGSQNLNNCREFLRQQCNPLAMPFLQSRLLPPSSCQVLRQQCCQELRQIELGYLHQAINSMARSFTHHQQQEEEKQQPYRFYGSQQASQMVSILMAAQYLPSMCGIYHSCGHNNSCHNKDASGARN
ncbi:hypothetical protein PAHAL_2G274400 [Panicum hallii]|uniref:Bifunctional inhibitor/plant lipid transfer protein/seed storage helical domain-containing protein n=1 Tax=Panicum hallii TaxID=206008 RepID=A0A2S3GZR2_9POAL|nr:hypothetical protein PAHAL_2G274400 [Panicum hallii]